MKISREVLTKINCTLGRYIVTTFFFFFNCKAVDTTNDLYHQMLDDFSLPQRETSLQEWSVLSLTQMKIQKQKQALLYHHGPRNFKSKACFPHRALLGSSKPSFSKTENNYLKISVNYNPFFFTSLFVVKVRPIFIQSTSDCTAQKFSNPSIQ